MKSEFYLARFLCTFLLMLLFLPLTASAETMTENQKIDRIIMKIKDMKNAEFIRNGENHTPQEAADHMRLKLGNAGNRLKSAEDFIKYCGTGSSVTGKPYKIKFSDGTEKLSADVLNDFLKDINAGN